MSALPILHDEKKDETPLLVALEVEDQGRKEVLSVSVAGAETADAWQGGIDDLKRRGVQQVDLWVTDGDAGLIGVLERGFPATPRQRCITHKERNVLAKVPPRRKKEVAAALKGVFAQPTRAQALEQVEAFRVRYEHVYPEAVTCLERDLPDCLTFYDFPRELWRHIRTNNALEGLFHTSASARTKWARFGMKQAACWLCMP